MLKHTKGPWAVAHSAGVGHADLIVSDHANATICEIDSDGPKEETEANARLIASAPDLLEACKMTMRCHRSRQMYDKFDNFMMENAISKAEA